MEPMLLAIDQQGYDEVSANKHLKLFVEDLSCLPKQFEVTLYIFKHYVWNFRGINICRKS